VIQERERPIRRQRRQPQREPRELHRGGIAIDAVETSLRNRPRQVGAVRFDDVARRPFALRHQRLLGAFGEIAARCDQECAAAHRRIDDAQLEDPLRWKPLDQRAKRAADEEVGDRARRIEAAGRLAFG